MPTRKPGFWSDIYTEGDPPWDLGAPAPALVEALESVRPPAGGEALVPGCGIGHEAIHLAETGWKVTAVDFAPEAVKEARTRVRHLPVRVVQSDIFELDEFYENKFNLVLEHTCYCAIPPELRPEYARVMATVLRNQGQLVGLFWEVEGEGPPYSTDPSDIDNNFSERFEIVELARARNSFAERRGEEWLVKMKRIGTQDGE